MNQEKKIGLITFVSQNYGTSLQGFAMKKAIERASDEGEVRFIHFVRSSAYARLTLCARLRNLLTRHSLKDIFLLGLRKKIEKKTSSKFRGFQNMILTDSQTYRSVDELLPLDQELSAVVCGSDMVWSPEYAQYLDAYLLTWCKHSKRISYAPSLGSINMEESLKHKYREALLGFNGISCRETGGCEFLQNLTGRDIQLVLDPTLLFSSSEWLLWFPSTTEVKKPYILVYCFGGISRTMRNQLRDYASKHGLALRFILSPEVSDAVHELKYGDGAYGPAEYVSLFANASFTVVNGYHGLLFSLIFEKPFVLLHRNKGEHWGAHESRMADILGIIRQEKRYLDPDSVIEGDMYELDYAPIKASLEKYKESSWDYLKKSLQ